MTILSEAKTVLEGDATLLATATGGVYDFDETGRLGINRNNDATSDAFDDGIIQPCVLLKLRDAQPDYLLADDANQVVSAVQVLEVWLYEDSGYSNIETMRSRVFALLHATQLTGSHAVRWDGDVRQQRDLDLDASVERSDYRVRYVRSTA